MNYDVLLIRGITPRQLLVSNSCSTPNKVYLMVGSIIDSMPKLSFSRIGIITWLLHKQRLKGIQTISKTAVMLANSPATVKELKDLYNIDSHFVPTNSIKLENFEPLVIRQIGDPIKLLFCGRVVKDKGIEELIESLGLLKKKGANAILEIVGKVDPEYHQYLSKLADTFGVLSCIHFAGYVSFGNELLNYYRHSDLYILPSWHEGFPHTVWEAAATCTPIIVTSVGGIPGLVSNKEVRFTKPKDPENIAEIIYATIKEPENTEIMVKNAYKLSLEYTVEKCAMLMAQIINEIFNPSKKN
jgi:glycosyltransferase involved in cell wall biosynthesis